MTQHPYDRDQETSLVLDAVPQSIAAARTFASSIARARGVPRERVEELKIAISEAVGNAVKAHRASTPGLPVHVVARADDGELVFEVVDWGGGFDVGAIPKRPPHEWQDLTSGGLGIFIIRALFPDARIGRNRQGGTTVTLAVETARMSSRPRRRRSDVRGRAAAM